MEEHLLPWIKTSYDDEIITHADHTAFCAMYLLDDVINELERKYGDGAVRSDLNRYLDADALQRYREYTVIDYSCSFEEHMWNTFVALKQAMDSARAVIQPSVVRYLENLLGSEVVAERPDIVEAITDFAERDYKHDLLMKHQLATSTEIEKWKSGKIERD